MPAAKHMALTASDLRDALTYDALTGVFVWKPNPAKPKNWNTRWAGRVAGERSHDGRVIIRINYTKYLAARLAWLHVTGAWPHHEIDHIDCDPSNDAFVNLRDATRRENMANTRLRARATSGSKGVCFDRARGKWLAHINVGGKFKNLGRYESKDAAAEAYRRAAVAGFGQFARVA